MFVCGAVLLYRDKIESFDIFFPLSSLLVGGSRNRLRFSGTDAATRPVGMDPELGYSGGKKTKHFNYLACPLKMDSR